MIEAQSWRVTVAAMTHNGRVRRNNEDCIAVGAWLQNEPMQAPRFLEQTLDAPLVCMVFDGMGGHADGEVAAQVSAQYLARELPACASEAEVAACLDSANRHLFERMREDPAHLGMGTTLAGVRISAAGIVVFNVGDSRVYRLQNDVLAQLSIDDVHRWHDGQPADRSGVITQALGGAWEFNEIEPHVSRQSLAASDTYLLCSDGLYDALAVGALESALGEDLAASASLLMERALAAGARDNVSVILVRLSG